MHLWAVQRNLQDDCTMKIRTRLAFLPSLRIWQTRSMPLLVTRRQNPLAWKEPIRFLWLKGQHSSFVSELLAAAPTLGNQLGIAHCTHVQVP